MCSINKTLLIRASGGLSNRLQAVISGIAYCLLTDRSICVDWRDGLYSDDFSNVFASWFDIHSIATTTCDEVFLAYEQDKSIKPAYWNKFLTDAIAVEYLFEGNDHTSRENKIMTSIELKDLNIKEKIAVYWHWNTDGLTTLAPILKEKFKNLNNLNDHEIMRHLLKKYLRPNKSLVEECNAFIKNNFTKKPIGIHIRHTDLQSPLPLMISKLQQIVTKQDELFLCTDNESVEKMIIRLFPQTVVRKKIYQGSNIPLHCYVEGISNVQKGRDAILDMLLLSRCKEIIHYSHSSFAKIPIILSGLEKQKIHSITV